MAHVKLSIEVDNDTVVILKEAVFANVPVSMQTLEKFGVFSGLWAHDDTELTPAQKLEIILNHIVDRIRAGARSHEARARALQMQQDIESEIDLI